MDRPHHASIACHVGLALLCALPGVAMAQRPDFSGHWELRDSPVRLTTDAARPSTPTKPRTSDDDRRQIGLLLGMASSVPSFTARQNDSTLVITNEDGFSYTLFLDGRESRLTMAESLEVVYRARWNDADLVVEWKPAGGGKLVETYTLAASRRFLQLDVVVEHGSLLSPAWRGRSYRLVETDSPL